MSILSVPMTIRGTQRLGHIARALARHGFGHLVARLRLRRYLPWSRKLLRRPRAAPVRDRAEKTVGQRLVSICEELGPTFVKLGQLLSSRPDIIPPDILADLKALQDRVASFPSDQAYAIIAKALGRPVDKLFAEFDPVPLASGSIAQTYRAKTIEGSDVVVKVRRPGIEQIIKRDMYLLDRLAYGAERYIPELTKYRPVAVVGEFGVSIRKEMDLLNEASITERLYRFFADHTSVVTPAVHWDLTSSEVLTLSFVGGRPFNDALADPHLSLHRTRLAKVLIDAFMLQYLELGVFNADPHPGNLFIIPPDRIGIVDFGMEGQIDKKRIAEFVLLLTACTYRQMDLAIDILTDMNAITDATDVTLLKRDLAALLDKYQALPLKHMSFQAGFAEISALIREHEVTMPRDFIMLGRSLVHVSGVALALDPDLNPGEVIGVHIRDALARLFGKENVTREMTLALWHGGMFIKDFPRTMRQLTRKAIRGQLRVNLEHRGMENLITELDRSSNRISFAMIIAGIIVGSGLIFHARIGPMWADMPILGLTGFVVAGVMGLWLVVAIIRSGKLS